MKKKLIVVRIVSTSATFNFQKTCRVIVKLITLSFHNWTNVWNFNINFQCINNTNKQFVLGILAFNYLADGVKSRVYSLGKSCVSLGRLEFLTSFKFLLLTASLCSGVNSTKPSLRSEFNLGNLRLLLYSLSV